MAKNRDKHKLVEVLCAFWFNPDKNEWDSTYFGKYYDLIKELGYTEKQERKGVQVEFSLDVKQKNAIKDHVTKELESRMVFMDTKKSRAVTLAPNYISFHKLEPYNNWETLMADQVTPGLKKYRELGLGNEVQRVQSLYLNKYTLEPKDEISNHIKLFPTMKDIGAGIEKSVLFQSQYEIEPNLLQHIKITSKLDNDNNTRNNYLECVCFADSHGTKTWEELVDQAHDQNNKVFRAITN